VFDKFYKLPRNSVDVLVLGSSHAFEDINPAVLYSEYGITAFDLTGSVQPLWNTYFYLIEALKTQSPKVIVLEAYCTFFWMEYSDESRIVKNTYGMKISKNYWNALKVSVPKEEFWDYFFRFTRYHNRYTELSSADFLPNQGNLLFDNWKGFANNTKHTPFDTPDVAKITRRSPMREKNERYYREIIKLCKERQIPLEIIVTPYVINARQQAIFNTASDIAQEYDIPFTNFNNIYEELGFDFLSDMADRNHANHHGSTKISNFLGKMLKEKYALRDNRNNPKMITWQKNADYFWEEIKSLDLKK
jgi:hypothetical protein